MNDLPLSLQFCILDLFADDATLSSSDSSIRVLTQSLNEDLKNFKDWCNNNDMLVNILKTKVMYVSSRYKVNQVMSDPPLLKIDNEAIALSSSEKLLGVHIDNTLSWTAQIENTIKNVTLYYIFSAESNVTCLYQSGSCFLMLTFCHILTTAVQYGVMQVLTS